MGLEVLLLRQGGNPVLVLGAQLALVVRVTLGLVADHVGVALGGDAGDEAV